MKLRFSKYNPIYRNSNGAYEKSEWTSFTDIGNLFDGNIFELKDYIKIEKKYLKSIKEIIQSLGLSEIQVLEFEKYCIPENTDQGGYYDALGARDTFKVNEIEDLLKIFLREYAWGILGIDSFLKIRFGYDFYVHLEIDLVDIDYKRIVDAITKNELYIG